MSNDSITVTIRSWANFIVPLTRVWIPVGKRWDKRRRRKVRMARKRRRGWA